MLLVILFGVCLTIYLFYESATNPLIADDGTIMRSEYGGGNSQYRLNVEFNDSKETVDVEIDEREYTDIELEMLAEETFRNLTASILNSAEDGVVRDAIKLPTALDNYPFLIRWKSSDENVVDARGQLLCPLDCTQYHDIILTASMICGEYRDEKTVPITIGPRNIDSKEKFIFQLLESISLSEEEKRHESTFKLPEEFMGVELSWTEPVPVKIFMIVPISVVISIVIGWAYDRDEKLKQKKRQENLEAEYPFFVEKLKLYILSGMTVKKAFCQIYKESIEVDSSPGALDKELRTVQNRFSNGVREEEVYTDFGARCGGSYKRLALLLTVNLKKGNDKLMSLIDEEVLRAQEHRKEIALRKSDQAGVKLLFPMIIMLMVVMLLIMVPAYFGISY